LYEARLQSFISSSKKIYVANLESYYYSFQVGGLLGHDTVQIAAQVLRFHMNLLQPSLGTSGFGGLGVSALAFGTQVRGYKPGRSHRIFQGEKILSAPSFGREVKPWVPCR
jgi:hypothetical protein